MNGSTKNGFIVFICGSDNNTKDTADLPIPNTEEESDDDSIDLEDDDFASFLNDAKVAKIYRDKVYYPFIDEIQNEYYDMHLDEDGAIPDVYTAVSWMDGYHGQLSMTTQEKVLEIEKKKKIITCKHSAA